MNGLWVVSHPTMEWNVEVSVQRSRKIPQTGGRPSSSLYGARARTTLSMRASALAWMGLQLILSVVAFIRFGLTITCDTTLVARDF